MTLLSVNEISMSFNGLSVLQDVTLEFGQGTITGLLGPNGAGKTTLFNLISGMLHPDKGRISLQSKDITDLGVRKRHLLGLGRTFQDLRLFEQMTVFDNVLCCVERECWLWQPRSGRNERIDRTWKSLTTVGLEEKAQNLTSELSYAERKFLAFARIIATGSTIWLLDEPASGLDAKAYGRMTEIVGEYVDLGGTVVLVDHTLDIIRSLCTKVAFLGNGRILALGAYEDVWANQDIRQLYFG